MLSLFGYIGAVIMGIVLGLVGGGGSILTVPILVYFFKLNATFATAYSLFVVGTAALVGSINYMQRRQVNFRIGLIFGIPALVGVYAARKYVVPAMPQSLFLNSALEVSKDSFILLVFAILMLFASLSMIKGRNNRPASSTLETKPSFLLLAFQGIATGLITGFVGAGGGFLIIPALVLLAGLEMKTAVGTSLAIIAVKSLIGFIGDVETADTIDWGFLAIFTGLGVLGILFGTQLSHHVSNQKLKPAFGWFVLVMGCLMLLSETVF